MPAAGPATANPHLFIHARNALGTGPAGQRWIKLKTGLTARALREDRILDEVNATGGDVRRLVDLFGLTVKAPSGTPPPSTRPDSVLTTQGNSTSAGKAAACPGAWPARGQPPYDRQQAREGAAGSAGRTESTSISNQQAAVLTIPSGPAADHGVTRERHG